MNIKYKDIIEKMERNGYYGEAKEYQDALRKHGYSEYENADRYNPADGAQYTYAGDKAEESYHNLRHEDQREKETKKEEQRLEQEQYCAAQKASEMQEEDDYWSAVNNQFNTKS